ncbi:MFS transporter [Embleya hyalina]|uniref:MFS transporter n=1 Tax=Embleya hyalina TaxID=516124 RepID=A0A401YID7_9ACTN|nr:MFS transporter [Embleya hyalina]GCD94382.1 MFS transporter [Embleya hyalina]
MASRGARTERVVGSAAPRAGGPRARNTAVLLAFTVVTNLADGITKIVLPVLAARATDSPALVTLVSLALSLPWLLVALHVGVLVDRADRRRLLWLAGGLRLLAIGGLLAIVLAGRAGIVVLGLGGLVLGVAEVIALTSTAALIPVIVPRSDRERANALITGAETAANEFAGPFVGGLLLAAGTGLALGATWVAYVAASLLLLLLTGRFRAVGRAGVEVGDEGGSDGSDGSGAPDAPGTVNAQIAEGLRYLWGHRLLRTMTLILTVLFASWGAWLALMPLVAHDTMHMSAREYGVVLSALGVGGLLGAVLVGRLNRLLGHRRVMLADLIATIVMMAVPAVTTGMWAIAGAAFVGGLGGTLWSVNARLIAQNLVPEHMMGRYSGAARLLGWGAIPVGAGLIGVLAEWFGVRAAFLAFAVAAAATIPPYLRVVTDTRLAPAFRVPGAEEPGAGKTGAEETSAKEPRTR